MLVHSTCQKCIHVCASLALHAVHESTTFKTCMRVPVVLHLKPFLSQVNQLLRFFDCTALGPTVIIRALTCLDKGPEAGGFSRVLGVVGIISSFMYQGDGDQLMNGPTAAVVIFFLLMCVKHLLLSLTSLLRYHTHTHTHTFGDGASAFCWLEQR